MMFGQNLTIGLQKRVFHSKLNDLGDLENLIHCYPIDSINIPYWSAHAIFSSPEPLAHGELL